MVTFGWDKPDKQRLLRSACVVLQIRECCFDHVEREIFKKTETLGVQGRRPGVCLFCLAQVGTNGYKGLKGDDPQLLSFVGVGVRQAVHIGN